VPFAVKLSVPRRKVEPFVASNVMPFVASMGQRAGKLRGEILIKYAALQRATG